MDRSILGVDPRHLGFVTRLHQSLPGLGAVVPGAKKLIERNGAVGVVHLEVLVMQVMREGVGVDGGVLAEHNLVEADMADHRARAGDVQMIEQQQRM